MKITFITLFPEIFPTFLNFSILKRAQAKGLIEFEIINLREFGEGAHQIVDDRPYGGGAGMVLKADILAKALKSADDRWQIADSKKQNNKNHPPSAIRYPQVILTSASGQSFKQSKARELSKLEHIIIVCGHYEGVDQRFIDKYVDEEISIGDYVLTGGELPSLVIADSITRLIPGVLEKEDATINESFEQNLLEYPHYTRPEEFEGMKVPEVLLSGNHLEIKKWQQKQSEEKTKLKRPDLITERI
jgi:tRNA (guanine37-N1)-methyltransferase